MERVLRIDLKKIMHVTIFIVLFFLMCGYEYWHLPEWLCFLWQHIDEFLVIFLTFYCVIKAPILWQKKPVLIVVWILFLFTGLISSIIYMYQPLIYALEDMLLAVNRFMVGYLATYAYMSKGDRNVSKDILPWAKIITVILFALALHDTFMTPFFGKGDYRYFADSLMLMFQHQTYLAASASAMLIFLGYCNVRNKCMPYMLMISYVDLMTLRSKALGFLAVYWLIYIVIILLKSKNYYVMMLLGSVAGSVIGASQFADYFLGVEYNPRSVLFDNGVKLSNLHFPLGTGFGTYASAIAQQFYSSLYDLLNFNVYYGLSREDRFYLSDSFWPIIIAQNGWLGLMLFVLVIAYFLKYAIIQMKIYALSGMAMLGIVIYMLVASIAETSFFNPVALIFFMMFAVFECLQQDGGKNEAL